MEQTDTSAPGPARLDAPIARAEEIVLCVLLSLMIALACYQIGLRWFTAGGLSWIDPLLRYLVLWSGLLGAALATARNNHICLDAVGYLLPGRVKRFVGLLTQLFAAVVSLFLFRATLLFISSEIEFGSPGLFGLATWVWFLIFPLAFGLILLHFSVSAAAALRALLRPETGGGER